MFWSLLTCIGLLWFESLTHRGDTIDSTFRDCEKSVHHIDTVDVDVDVDMDVDANVNVGSIYTRI